MRSLTFNAVVCSETEKVPHQIGKINEEQDNRIHFEQNLSKLKKEYHSQCLFHRKEAFLPDLNFHFDNQGILHGTFVCTRRHQGYDNMTHGGIISAIVDASMAQCLMGHGIAGYTTELNIKYRKPVLIDIPVTLKTMLKENRLGCLYLMRCEIIQDCRIAVTANAHFYSNHKSKNRIHV